MKRFVIFIQSLLILTISFNNVFAQVISSSPALPTATDDVVVTFNAALGGGNMAGYPGDVYAHTGVIVEGNASWQYVIGSWGNNTTQPQLTRIGTDLYQLNITPSIREFYNVPENVTIIKLCFVFRASTGSPQSEDLFIDVVEEGLTVKLTSPQWELPFYNFGSSLNIEAQANSSETIILYVNNTEVSSTTEADIAFDYTIDSYGKQWVKAVATYGSDTVADSVYFYVRGEIPVASLPSGAVPGVNIIGTDEVTLVLHDPPALKEFVFIIGDFNDWELDDTYYMNRTPDGKHYWITLTDLNPTTEYIFQYWVDGEIKLADPYCDKISDPWNDKWISSTNYPNLIQYPDGKTSGVASVFQIQQEEYQWEVATFNAPAKSDLVIYELHLRDFVSDDYIVSAMEKLDYLERLGVNAVELMPINEFDGNDSWGYNPAFYFAPDKAYGTKNNYKQFIDECHKRGMAVIIDMVLNHSFGLSPLVKMYFDANAGDWGQPSADNPWYNETCPHEPWCWGYDFDHLSPYTEDFIDRVAEYWLTEFKVDGFRFDFTKGFTNYQSGGDGWNYNAQRIGILKRYADFMWSVNPNTYVILEHFCDNSEEKELAEYRSGEGKGMLIWGNINHNYAEASMSWISNSNFNWVSYLQRGYSVPHVVGYMESHDEERLMYKNLIWGNSTNANYNVKNLDIALGRQKLTGAFFFTIPGPKMIWQFGELGYDYSINHCPDGTLSDGCRTSRKPVRWDYYGMLNRRSLFNTWGELIALRKDLPVFETNDFNLSVAGAGKIINLYHSSMNVVIVGNFDVTEQNITATFPNSGQWFEYFTQSQVNIESTSTSFTMAPGEYRMYSSVYINREDYILNVNQQPINESGFNVMVWPNPVSNQLSISINSDIKETFEINLLDVNGKQITNVHNGTLYPGENHVSWKRIKGVPSGMYILSVQTKSYRKAIKVFIN